MPVKLCLTIYTEHNVLTHTHTHTHSLSHPSLISLKSLLFCAIAEMFFFYLHIFSQKRRQSCWQSHHTVILFPHYLSFTNTFHTYSSSQLVVFANLWFCHTHRTPATPVLLFVHKIYFFTEENVRGLLVKKLPLYCGNG